MDKILAVTINLQDKQIKPTTEAQIVTADENYSGLDKVVVDGVTSAIDSNIKPENIKKDVEILGVTGTMESASVPTKSWLYITEYDSNGYPIKAKTIGCSGNMPNSHMYGDFSSTYPNALSRYILEFEINEGVTSISRGAFQCCNSLASIVIPDSVTKISYQAFKYCNNLTSINIPDGVTIIDDETFYDCRILTSITLPSALTKIAYQVFFGCNKLSLFDFRKVTQVPTLSSTNAFQNTPSTKKIVVPDSLYETWITATNWSSSTNNIVSSIIKASDYEASL